MPLKRDPTGQLAVLGAPPGVHDDREALKLLDLRLQQAGFPKAEIDFRFLPDRKFRGDLVWPLERIVLERDGGVWIKGRHVTAQGFERDAWKQNFATAAGWRILRFTPGMLRDDWSSVVQLFRDLFTHSAG